MDGNAKMGLLGENVSRNGKLLLQVAKDSCLTIMNKSEKCHGKVTRQDSKHPEKRSAIDFVFASPVLEKSIIEMKIDEDGMFRLKGKNETDHNSIMLKIELTTAHEKSQKRKVQWRLNAPTEKWEEYRRTLTSLQNEVKKCVKNEKLSIDERYGIWTSKIIMAATG